MATEETDAAIAKLKRDLAGAWRSERLVYRTVASDDAADVAFIHSINSDPTNLAMSSDGLLRPRAKLSDKAFADMLAKTMLGAMICLPEKTTKDDGDEEEEEKKKKKKKEDDDDKDNNKKDRPIGFLCLGYGADGDTSHSRHAALGIALAPAHQGRGYGGEAVRWAVGWAFGFANLHSVGLSVVAYNDRARRTYERVGFVLEGRSREVVFCGGRYWDLLRYSVLEGEWEKKAAVAAAAAAAEEEEGVKEEE